MAAQGPGSEVRLVNNDIILCQMVAYKGDQVGLWGMHYRFDGTTGVSTLGDAVSSFAAVMAPLQRPITTIAAVVRGAIARRVWPEPPSAPSWDVAVSAAGGVLGDALPTQTSGLIRKKTQFGGQKYRGRAYIPFPGESDSDANGLPLAAYTAALIALSNVLQADVQIAAAPGDRLVPVIYHRGTLGQFTPVTACEAIGLWATQRRRGSLGKANPQTI